MTLSDLRTDFHREVCVKIIRLTRARTGGRSYPNLADANNRNSISIAHHLVTALNCDLTTSRSVEENFETQSETDEVKGSVGTAFENACKEFIHRSFKLLEHLRPGNWQVARNVFISNFDQYAHLAGIEAEVARVKRSSLEAGRLLEQLLGRDYIVKPDIVIARASIEDEEINRNGAVILDTDQAARLTPLRSANSPTSRLILHASISCKWTVRSDRSQNTRTEALNLIRNRKGHLPHVVAITAEPLPTRIASLAQGTGDLDCVYHFALPELRQAVERAQAQDQLEVLNELVEGRRLRDISDLTFDLAV